MAKIERTKNASRNIVYGVILKAYQILVPFLMCTAMIYLMGVQYLGLSSLFTSVLQVLNLTELGVGTAMVYSMYKPIAEDDDTTICALMKLYRTYYRVIGLVIAVVGCALTPFIPHLIKSDVPTGINIYILYLLNLAATVLSYWLFAYKGALLQAHQRTDLTSKVTILVTTLQYGSQLAVLWAFKSYYLYVIVMLISQVFTNIITAFVASKTYPKYQPRGELDKHTVKQINRKILDVFTSKLGTVLGTSVDSIVISACLGLSMLAIYQNYFYIMNSVIGFIIVIFTSITAGIGNSLVVETNEKNYGDFSTLTFMIKWLCVVCISCFACLYQTFMRIWVGEDLLLPNTMVALLCLYFYLYVMQSLSCVYKDAAGIWHQDRFRPLIAGILNLILNLTFVKIWGIYAIILSTIISYIFVAMPWVIKNLFKYVFHRSPVEYAMELLKGVVLSAIIASICWLVCSLIRLQGIVAIILFLILALLISNVLLFLLYKRNSNFMAMLNIIDKMTKYKFVKITNRLRS